MWSDAKGCFEGPVPVDDNLSLWHLCVDVLVFFFFLFGHGLARYAVFVLFGGVAELCPIVVGTVNKNSDMFFFIVALSGSDIKNDTEINFYSFF